MIKHALRTASLSLAVTAALSGCTGAPTPGTQSSATSSTGASGTPTPVEPTATVVTQQVQRFDLGDREAWPIAMTPTEVVVPVTAVGGAVAVQVRLLDLTTGEQSVVASTEWPAGAIGAVAASGDWVVWVDEKRVSRESAPWAVLWKIWAKDTVSGAVVLLDTNGPADTIPDFAAVPALVAGDGYVSWQKTGSDEVTQRLLWQVGSPTPQTLDLPELGRVTAIADGTLIFLRPASSAWGQSRGLGDCWSYPVDGSGPAQELTDSGLVRTCAVSGADLVWTEHIDPATHDRALVSKTGDYPYLLMAMSLDRSTPPRTLHEGTMQLSGPFVGDDFAWWAPFGAPQISALSITAQGAVKDANRVFTWVVAAQGDLVAYQRRRPKKSTVINVVRVVPEALPTTTGTTSPTDQPSS